MLSISLSAHVARSPSKSAVFLSGNSWKCSLYFPESPAKTDQWKLEYHNNNGCGCFFHHVHWWNFEQSPPWRLAKIQLLLYKRTQFDQLTGIFHGMPKFTMQTWRRVRLTIFNQCILPFTKRSASSRNDSAWHSLHLGPGVYVAPEAKLQNGAPVEGEGDYPLKNRHLKSEFEHCPKRTIIFKTY